MLMLPRNCPKVLEAFNENASTKSRREPGGALVQPAGFTPRCSFETGPPRLLVNCEIGVDEQFGVVQCDFASIEFEIVRERVAPSCSNGAAVVNKRCGMRHDATRAAAPQTVAQGR